MKKGLKKFIGLIAVSAILVPAALASATPSVKSTLYFNSTFNKYQDSVIVSSIRAYAWSDSYADSGVTTVKAFAYASGTALKDDSGRYWAEADVYGSNPSGWARSEAFLSNGTLAQHWRSMPFNNDNFYNCSY